jgi:hypothetical protein
MAEVGALDRVLPGLNIPAPIVRGRGLWFCRLALCISFCDRPHARFYAAFFGMVYRDRVGLADVPARLPWGRFGLYALSAELVREAFAVLL